MITRFKSALDKIEAEEELINKTEDYLRATLNKKQTVKLVGATKSSLFSINRRLAIVACFVFFFVGIGGTGAYAYYKTPVSYLSLDINPSVELGINAFGKVIKVQGYNDDGEKVLEGIKIEGYNVTKAVKAFVESADNNGYIASDGSTVVSVTSETDNPELATELQNLSEEGANEALDENNKEAVVEKDNVPLSLNKEARELGITPGKLNLIRKLQEVDPSATIEQYKDASVKTIMKTIQKNNDNGAKGKEDTSTVEEEGTVDKATGTVNNENKGNEENKNAEKVNNKNNDNEESIDEDNNNADKGNSNIDKANKNDNTGIKNSDSDKVNNGNGKAVETVKGEGNGNSEKKDSGTVNKKDEDAINKKDENSVKSSGNSAVEKQKNDKGNNGNSK